LLKNLLIRKNLLLHIATADIRTGGSRRGGDEAGELGELPREAGEDLRGGDSEGAGIKPPYRILGKKRASKKSNL